MQRVAVIGEWGVGNEWSGQRWLGEWGAGNEWSGQRCWGNGERGTSGAGSGVGREGSGEQVQRVAVPGEWEAGKVGKA